MIIYGAGKRGQVLYEKCKKQKVKVEGFIDKRAHDIDNSIFSEDVVLLTINEAIAHSWHKKTVIISPTVCDDIVCELQNLGFQDIICLNDIFEWSPYTPVKDRKKDFQYAHPFGHYDSPYADLAFVRKNKNQIYNVNKK